MFVFEDVTTMMTNPCNLMGVAGKGLSLEFRRRCPDFIERYREVCRNKELRIGTVVVLEDVGQSWDMLLFPTKVHYSNFSEKSEIIRGLEALRELLQTDKYRYCSVGLPMLGTGCGAQDYENILGPIIDHLGDLDATIFLSMAPQRTEIRPKYLVIAGPPDFGLTEEDKTIIDSTIDKVMTAWKTDLSEYEGIISGGFPGVDTYIAGKDFNKNYEDTFTYKRTQKAPLVIKPNVFRHGVGANLMHGNLLCEAASDIILIKPVGHNNNRLSAMQMWLENDKAKRASDGHAPRRIAIFGEHHPKMKKDQILVAIHRGDD